MPKAGAVLVTVNTNYQRAELEYLLRQADVHTLILMQQHRGNSYVQSLKPAPSGARHHWRSCSDEVRSTCVSGFSPRDTAR